MLTAIETLIMNRVRDALKQLSKEGIGYIEQETAGHIYYAIDGRFFDIRVGEEDQGKNKGDRLK